MAATATSAVKLFIVQVVPVPEHAPDQPPNVPKAVSVSVTSVPTGKPPTHEVAVLAQLTPKGELVTVPEPEPGNVTVTVGSDVPPPPLLPLPV